MIKNYGVKPQRTNPIIPKENGDVEQSQQRVKRAVEQALLLRGSHEFDGLAGGRQFLKELIRLRNADRRAWLAEEIAVMRASSAGWF